LSYAEGKGDTLDYLTPEEVAQWVPLFQPYIDEWIADAEAKGWPAREIYEEAKRLVEKYNKE
jgi:hypothetical protein